MTKISLLAMLLSIVGIAACQRKTVQPAPEVFNFKSLTLNGKNSSGSPFTNVSDLQPQFAVSFTAPVDRTSAQSTIVLVNGSATIPVNYSFSNNDSTVNLKPQNPLAHLTQYSFQVYSSLNSKQKTLFSNTVNIGVSTSIDTTDKFPRISDEALLDLVQKQTFKYFWDFGHPVSGMARERNTSGDIVTSGGTGFGVMAMVVAAEHKFVPRKDIVTRLLTMTNFLNNIAVKHHGALPHWLNGATGATIAFSPNDNGADLVETSYLMQSLITARQYFNTQDADEIQLRQNINTLWDGIEWNWFTKSGAENNLYWHWSPDKAWVMNMPIRGWNEALITYIMAASSNKSPIAKAVYDNCWANNGTMKNGNSYYGIKLPLGPNYGGPLFFSQYSFLGTDPRTLSDTYANYWEQNTAHTKINYTYCVTNPKNYVGYSANCWGLTASDIQNGYSASAPDNDLGVISPTAALSAMPYAPKESMQALRFFYYKLGDKTWKDYGFIDAFNLSSNWFADSFLAIDQGPIIIMIENQRSGLLWKNFMSAPEVQRGLTNLGFKQ